MDAAAVRVDGVDIRRGGPCGESRSGTGRLWQVKRILIIGIGAGDPDHLTLQAVKAIARTDVFFVLDKGEAKHDLVQLRHDLVDAHARPPYRIVEAGDPERDRTTPAYAPAVEDWRSRRADICERFIRDELDEGQTGAFLVWGILACTTAPWPSSRRSTSGARSGSSTR